MSSESENTPPSRAQISEGLKRVYESYVDQDMPDRFSGLMERLREKERGMEEDSDK
ncbi:NepR family anti-sigma factor [Aestuariibius sp. 2305UL40-4]|uniref:NepR family anti-sigma factor n=1 Tax=Aestuariibius violaceus TaxID=3234132 RepID=UPI00345EE646